MNSALHTPVPAVNGPAGQIEKQAKASSKRKSNVQLSTSNDKKKTPLTPCGRGDGDEGTQHPRNSALRTPHSTLTRTLGQYFTPKPVVDLCYRFLRIADPDTSNPKIIDPACGEGAFLIHALENGITTPKHIHGIEKDPNVAASWDERGLSGKAILSIGDGLSLPLALSPTHPIAFDWVVGNPPFGTLELRKTGETEEAIRVLESAFTIWRGGRKTDLDRYQIEILFLERFIQLAKPGGHIAIILPDGMLSNARLAYVREWLANHARVKAVISLPQHTFHRNGAAAKSSVLLLEKNVEHPTSTFQRSTSNNERKNGGKGEWETANLSPLTINHQPSTIIFMAALEERKQISNGIEQLANAFSNSALRTPHSTLECFPWLVYNITDLPPDARLDPAYYHPKYTENIRVLREMPNVVSFGNLIEYTTYGSVGGREYTESGMRYITPANLVVTEGGFVSGVDIHSPERFVAIESWNDPPRSRLRKGDLLLANSGVGCIGRAAVFLSDEPCNISQHINLIRVKGIEPEYLAIYLQTRFARLQIHREKCGVGTCGINFNRIRSILVPVLPNRSEFIEGYVTQPIAELVKKLEACLEHASAQ